MNNGQALSINKRDPEAECFSLLIDLEDYRLDGKFIFKLSYPDMGLVRDAAFMTWSQTSNPTEAASKGRVEGFIPIDVRFAMTNYICDYDNDGNILTWEDRAGGRGGLTYDGHNALMNGEAWHTNWHFAVGSKRYIDSNDVLKGVWVPAGCGGGQTGWNELRVCTRKSGCD
jgi:hypothetical protein